MGVKAKINLDHALCCKTGGLITRRYNVITHQIFVGRRSGLFARTWLVVGAQRETSLDITVVDIYWSNTSILSQPKKKRRENVYRYVRTFTLHYHHPSYLLMECSFPKQRHEEFVRNVIKPRRPFIKSSFRVAERRIGIAVVNQQHKCQRQGIHQKWRNVSLLGLEARWGGCPDIHYLIR